MSSSTTKPDASAGKKPSDLARESANNYPWYSPRFWNGMRVGGFARLLSENGFRIHPSRWPMTVLGSATSSFNTVMSLAQRVTHGGRVDREELVAPPVFITGHWRSGTTLMHELMSLDPGLAFPNNYDAFSPGHALLTGPLFSRFVDVLMPGQRPMDDMGMRAFSPCEDDFALISLGAPTPYRRIAFPNNRNDDHRQLDTANLTDKQRRQLTDALESFFKMLSVRYGQRLVLKSPPHTGRIGLLAEKFPGAKFVHMSRHPEKVMASTMRLWKLIDHFQGFQRAGYDDNWLKEFVFECQQLMYTSYFRDRAALQDNQLIEIRMEQLVAEPAATIKQVYDQLDLGDCGDVLPLVEGYFGKRDYR
ncbi:MAG: sulfotransferase, partial [Planctomycetota bacterium]